jgi:hypothetical protein
MNSNIKPVCSKANCSKLATHSSTQFPEVCSSHATEEKKDVVNFDCGYCCNTLNKYTNYYKYLKLKTAKKYEYKTADSVKICVACYHRRQNRGHKEDKIKPMLDSIDPNYTHDKTVIDGCSGQGSRVDKDGKRRKNGSYRPDFLYELTTHNIVIEIDENQHASYGKLCINSIEKELSRMINMNELDLAGVPTIFVRFNPDSYKNASGDIIKTYSGRESTLKKLIKSIINIDKMESNIVVYYLFYDGFDGRITSSPITYKHANGKIIIKHKHPLEPNTNTHIFDI